MTLYAFGSPMRRVFGLVPLAAEHALAIAILSYDGKVTFGIVADHDAVRDLDVVKEGIETTLADLLELSRPRQQTRRRPRASG